MTLSLYHIGTAEPTHSIRQNDAATLAATFCGLTSDQTRPLEILYRRTRIERRGSVLLEQPEGTEPRQTFMPPSEGSEDHGPTTALRMERYAEEAPLLAVAAAQEALEGSGIAGREIEHLITVSCTGFVAPGFDIRLIKDLDLSLGVARTHVGFMGCHGALNGLRIAAIIAAARPSARVLVCAAELCSLHYQYGQEPDKLVANAIFADGAAAVVCGGPRPVSEGAVSNNTASKAWRLVRSGSQLFPDSEDAMTWRVGNHGFEMTLSARVPDLIATHLRPWLENWLSTAGLSVAEVGSWAIHPGGPRILDQAAAGLGLSAAALEPSRRVMAEHGNMSSPTILFILQRLLCQQAPRPCVALAFGPGLVVEAALFA
jgi:predicted naringenin-chalcone synthase